MNHKIYREITADGSKTHYTIVSEAYFNNNGSSLNLAHAHTQRDVYKRQACNKSISLKRLISKPLNNSVIKKIPIKDNIVKPADTQEKIK